MYFCIFIRRTVDETCDYVGYSLMEGHMHTRVKIRKITIDGKPMIEIGVWMFVSWSLLVHNKKPDYPGCEWCREARSDESVDPLLDADVDGWVEVFRNMKIFSEDMIEINLREMRVFLR